MRMEIMLRRLVVIGSLALVLAADEVTGQDYPRVVGKTEIELQYDYFYDADLGRDRGSTRYISDLFTTTELGVALEVSPAWSIQTGLVLEPVRSPIRDRTFDDLGFYGEQLYLRYAASGFSLFAGKYNPLFGIAWNAAPGVYGTDFAEDYEVTEQIGLGATYAFATEAMGAYSLEGSAFTADTSVLSKSVFTKPRRTDTNVERASSLSRANGGVANTGRLNNAALSAAVDDVPSLEGLAAQVSFLLRQAGRTESSDERGTAFGLTYEAELETGVKIALLSEYAVLDDFSGANQTARYFTYGGEINWDSGWLASAIVTKRDLDPAAGFDDDGRKRLVTATIGYAFSEGHLQGLKASIGWKNERSGASDTDSVGLQFTYDYDFALVLRDLARKR